MQALTPGNGSLETILNKKDNDVNKRKLVVY